MIRLSVSFFVLCVLASQCFGQYVGPPAPIAGYYTPSNIPNVSTLYVTYCLAGKWPCSEYRVKAWGQMCSPSAARDQESNLSGTVLPGYRYVSWRCELADPNEKPPYGISGTADEWPDMPPRPTWTFDPAVLEAFKKKGGGVVSWFSSSGESGIYILPNTCHLNNERGHPIKSWWARQDGNCYTEDAPK